MAKLYATSPNGTAKSIDLETMNIPKTEGSGSIAISFPNGMLLQRTRSTSAVSTGVHKIVFPLAYNHMYAFAAVSDAIASSHGTVKDYCLTGIQRIDSSSVWVTNVTSSGSLSGGEVELITLGYV